MARLAIEGKRENNRINMPENFATPHVSLAA